jgi:hypothetical protein
VNFKHGKTSTPEYRVWRGIRGRCLNPKHKQFKDYGGRGITICERWSDFRNFLSDMGSRPSRHHSVHRKDNNGPYDRGNCEWATPKIQARRRRNNRVLYYNGKLLTVAEWAERIGVPPSRILRRLGRGMSIGRALSKPSFYNIKHATH